MATKLEIWNKALQLIGDTKLTSTSEAVPQRHELDTAWATCVLDVFAAGFWNFATVTASLAESGSPIIGYAYRFALPSDLLRVIQVSGTARFLSEADYRIEGAYIYGQVATLRIRYVSSTLSDDGSVTGWPPSFVEALAARLAAELSYKTTTSRERADAMWAFYERRLADSLMRDEMNNARLHRAPLGGMAVMSGPPAPSGQQGEAA